MISDRKKIIVVDDNLENLTAIKNTLKNIYDVYPTNSAAKMFELLERFLPDLILLDVAMPDVNGYEAAEKLKENDEHREIPVIFLTSMDDAKSEIEGLSLGAVDYIHKPFFAPLLLQRIRLHLSLEEQKKVIQDRNREIENLLELKTREVSLREAAELEAQNASRAKSEFLSRMSHEIRSPLNAVIGMINIAADEDDVQAIRGYIKKADSASRYLMGVINDILDMSKIEANKLELSCGETNFREMLANIINMAGVRAEEKHQHIAVNVNENVPPSIICDELRLSQVITNLLSNAVKFTPENGKVVLSVERLEDSNDGITLRIEVADSGIGISEEQQKKLFTSFNQADSSISKTFGGTGLGLAISKRIVELMRGEIWIESELNKGSKFIFTIKVEKGTDKAGKASSGGGQGKTSINFEGYTILAAEDMEFNREILAKYLEKTGISIDFAENGKVAVSMFREHPGRYNLIFMDIHMPEMEGEEATRQIRAIEAEQSSAPIALGFSEGKTQNDNRNLRQQIPVIAMTANAFKEDTDKYLAAGMDDYIAKPVMPKDIFVKLNKYLKQ